MIFAVEHWSEFLDELELVLLEFHGIFFPEPFGMNWAPLQMLRVNLSCIFVEIAQDSDIILQNCAGILDVFDQSLILDISLQKGIDNFEQFAVNQ